MAVQKCLILSLVFGAAVVVSGCGQRASIGQAEIAAHRSKYVLADEPASAIGVSDARLAVGQGSEIVVVGRVGGVKQPWAEGQAAFFIHDAGGPEDPSHDHVHDGQHADHGDHEHPHNGQDHAHDEAAHAHDDHEHDDHEHDDHEHDDHADDAHAHDEADHAHAGHDHAGDHHDCPFCKAAEAGSHSLAIVQFVDDRGDILPIDSRDLLGIEEQQTVVVRGHGRIDELGNLIVSASGIYLRK